MFDYPRIRRFCFAIALVLNVSHSTADDVVFSGLPDWDMPPYHWYDWCEHSWHGAIVSTLEMIFSEAGLSFKMAGPIAVSQITPAFLFGQLLSGEWDLLMLPKMPLSPDIQMSSNALLSTEMVILYRNGLNMEPENLDDFTGFSGKIFLAATLLHNQLRARGLQLSVYDDPKKALDELLNGQTDYLVINRYSSSYLLYKHKAARRLLRYEDDALSNTFYLAALTQDGNSPVIDAANRIMARDDYTDKVAWATKNAMQDWMSNKPCARQDLP